MKRIITLFILVMILFSCKSLVQRFDERLNKKYLKKGFIEKTLDSAEESIHYYDNQLKDKPVVVFVHGFGGDGKISWWRQAKDMYKDFRVIVPDILWFGESKSNTAPTLMAQIEMVKTIIISEQLANVNLVGISYGGFIALGYAKKHSQDLNTLTIVDSPGPATSNAEVDLFCERVGAESVQDAFIPESASDVQHLVNFSFKKPPKLTDGIMEETIGLYFSKHPKEQAMLLDELPNNRSWMTGGTNLPTLILWGEEDQVFLVEEATELQQALGAQLEVVPNAGHALPGEQPKEFNRILREFLSKN